MQHSLTKKIFEHLAILTEKNQKYQSLQMNTGLSYHIKLFVELLDGQCPSNCCFYLENKAKRKMAGVV